MSIERKLIILAGVFCILGACVGLILAGIAVAMGAAKWAIPALIVACLSFWIGDAIASVLKKNPE